MSGVESAAVERSDLLARVDKLLDKQDGTLGRAAGTWRGLAPSTDIDVRQPLVEYLPPNSTGYVPALVDIDLADFNIVIDFEAHKARLRPPPEPAAGITEIEM